MFCCKSNGVGKKFDKEEKSSLKFSKKTKLDAEKKHYELLFLTRSAYESKVQGTNKINKSNVVFQKKKFNIEICMEEILTDALKRLNRYIEKNQAWVQLCSVRDIKIKIGRYISKTILSTELV